MKRYVFHIVLCVFVCRTGASLAHDTIRVRELGLAADSRINAVPYVNAIMERCRGKRNVLIVFDKGRYDFWLQHCIERTYYESNTTLVNPRRLALVVDSADGLVVEGNGAEFIFHDRMQPFTIDHSRAVTIRNVSVDWDIPLTAEAEVADATVKSITLRIDREQFPYVVEGGKLFFVGEGWKSLWGGVKWNDPMEFDRQTLEVVPGTGDEVCLGDGWEAYAARELEKGLVRVEYDFRRTPAKGNYLVLRHSERDHSGVFIVDSQDVLIENMNMYSNAGLGFLSQYSENIAFRNVRCIPRPGKRVIASGHDDGFHYSNCKGRILVDRCSFAGLMDDAINVHGTCVQIQKRLGDHTLLCRFMHHQSVGLRWAQAGERVGFIEHKTMATLATGRVNAFQPKNVEFFEVSFKEPVPGSIGEGDALENLTWTPDVTVRNSRFGSHRARGILVSTPGKVVIEGNVFGTSGSAIVVPGDANHWFESGAVRDVTISNNLFTGSCLTSLYQFCEGIISICPEIPSFDSINTPFHRNVHIVNNAFESFDYPLVYAKSVGGLVFANNQIKRSYAHTPFHSRKQTLTFDTCRDVEVRGNRIGQDVLGKNIKLVRMTNRDFTLDDGQAFTVER